MCRRVSSKVRLILGSMEHWEMPGMTYSTGSSAVMMDRSGVFRWWMQL